MLAKVPVKAALTSEIPSNDFIHIKKITQRPITGKIRPGANLEEVIEEDAEAEYKRTISDD